MTPEDSIYRYRLRTLALAAEIGSVRAACRVMGIHHSTYYRWKSQADRYGLDILRPRERRRPQMPNSISPLVEQRILAFSIGNPGLEPGQGLRRTGPRQVGRHKGLPVRHLAGAQATWP